MHGMPLSDDHRPLRGVRIVDLSWLLPGPLFTGMLSDLGADVVKIERPGDGDYARQLLPGMFRLVNRGKRSAVLDLRLEADREVLLDLAATADVFVEGFRPGVVDRLGVGYEEICKRNESILYVSLTGYGQDGPAAGQPGHDVNYCGHAGLLRIPSRHAQTGASRMQLPISDIAGAMYAAVSTLAALRHRDATGRGTRLDVSLADCALAWSAIRWADAPDSDAASWKHISPLNDIFIAADGVHLAVALVEEQFRDAFRNALEPHVRIALDEAAQDPDRLQQYAAGLFRTKSSAAWLDLAQTHDLPITRIAGTLSEMMENPVYEGRGIWPEPEGDERATISLPAFPIRFNDSTQATQAPAFGADSQAARAGWDALFADRATGLERQGNGKNGRGA